MSSYGNSAQPLRIILDDKRGDAIALSGADTWAVSQADQWFNGTSQSPDYALKDKTKFGTLEMKFDGISAAFFGTTPPPSSSQSMNVSIDGNSSYSTSYADPNPQTYRQWYQTPQLAEGTHDIKMSNIAGTAFDFAVVTVGKNTPLAGQTVIVDNDDPGIVFSDAKWRRSQEQFNSGPNPDGFAFANTTHETSYVGSSFAFRFTGKAVAVYGIRTWANIGLITLTSTLDGVSLSQSFRVNADTPQFKAEIGQQPNFKFYTQDFLTSGDHTLVVNLTECVNQTFSFDYLTYIPTFPNLASMPSLSAPTIGGSAGAGTAKAGKKPGKVAIVVGIIGALILVSLLLGLVYILRRRRRRGGKASSKRTKYTAHPFIPAPRGEMGAIPLAHQTSPPPSASTYHGDALSRMQGQGSMRAQQSPYNRAEDDPFTSYTGIGGSGSHSPGQGSPGTMTPPNRDFNRRPARDTQWTSGAHSVEAEYGELEPPSYDEITGGQPPTHISYVVQR